MLSTGMTERQVRQQDCVEKAQLPMRSDWVANGRPQKHGFLTAQIYFGDELALGGVWWALNVEFVIFRIGTGNIRIVEIVPILWLVLRGRDGGGGLFLKSWVSALTGCFEGC